MSNSLRSIIFNKVVKPLQNVGNIYQDKIMSQLCLHSNDSNDTNDIYRFALPLKTKYYDITNEVQNITKDDSKDVFDSIVIEKNTIYFNILRNRYIKTILESNYLGITPPLLLNNNKKIIVEFSSPNIAKPFHLGHLRSTVIGNYIANINNFLQNKVKKINYLGDWGTQVGFIQVGMEIGKIDNNELQTDPIKTFYKAYVYANKMAAFDSSISERAREVLKQLESEDTTTFKNWQTFKNYTVQELERTYKRLGVVFDEYHWESMYNAKNTNHIISLLEKMQLLILDNENRKVIPLTDERNIAILKSDGSTLYLTRDIAAAIDRFEKNKFDTMYYVVDKAQTDHFSSLMQILHKMEIPWVDRLKHIQFGRVRGLSSRKGTAVFLEDILNEARDIIHERQKDTATCKVSLDKYDNSSEILGISAVIVNDLKRSRMKDYEFDWKLVVNTLGDTGVKLQYTHARLYSLIQTCGVNLTAECNPSVLTEKEVDDLIILIGKFDEIILKSHEESQPCVLTVYLLRLCNAISKAFKILNVKNVPLDIGNQRLLLFHVAKLTLAQGMKILGLTPLDKM